jgi:hypothetical protein
VNVDSSDNGGRRSGSQEDGERSLIPRTRAGKLAHLLFWTALFYGLAWGIAELAEWLSP